MPCHVHIPVFVAITGIGSENMQDVGLDNHARMDHHHLEVLLNECLEKKQAVYAVVCILGSTEHGAVDPLAEVVRLRNDFQKKGLSFMIHVDGAWASTSPPLV